MAQIIVRYFAAAAEAAGLEQETWDLGRLGDPGAVPTVGALRARLVERHGPGMARVLRSGSFLVDGRVRRDDDAELTGATVDVLPPFAGG